MEFGIKGNSAIVSASSSGLGKASAKALAEEGVNVMVNGRDQDKIKSACDEIDRVSEARVLGMQADLTSKSEMEDLVSRTIGEFGTIDHLVLNSGGPPSGGFLDTTDEDWIHAFELLVLGPTRLIRASLPELKSNDGGTIVSITSRTVKEPIESLVLSNSVRMSVIGLMKSISKEFAPNVRANSVLPGPHETDRAKELVQDGVARGDYQTYEEGLQKRSEDIPLARLGQPDELGDLVAFLSSERSGYISGAAVPIEGGWLRSSL